MSIVTLVDGDDWKAVYLNDALYYEGHDIPGHVWLEILGLLVEVRGWWSEWPEGRADPSLRQQWRQDNAEYREEGASGD